ncbi:Protein of unknown function [Granulicella rosea]|uniref:DUF3891 domain-containing protein n=1 Tax=Granulicella rosea TaxID=474952 RepID=A0A239M8F3_9BACT|nr:DUF3891 family protein [Granulicella rosea]SNT38403.1 Protein of unknown function [Granulicella rosea]
MLRFETEDGWWLVTHPDHARLAGDFSAVWGNALFAAPEPREHVLRGIHAHDDGWAMRDRKPVVTREGKPAAFSTELVGAYSAFEEIDLEQYLAVRRGAVQLMADEDAYAAILISMHTYNLLSERADRRTIRAEQLPLLDTFLEEQLELQWRLQKQLVGEGELLPEWITWDALKDNFRLLQATDNLSLLSCVDYAGRATLLHPLRKVDGAAQEIVVAHTGVRSFRLTPYPFATDEVTFELKARFVPGPRFTSSEQLQALFDASAPVLLRVTIHA